MGVLWIWLLKRMATVIEENCSVQVGHDWGGAITWALAEDYPSKLRKIVVVNSPHFSVLDQAIRTNLRQLRRSWYICEFC
jgi:pimeloyl-ACP methyl ester carboxylesterase